MNEVVLNAASLMFGLTGAAGTQLPRRLTRPSEPLPLENAHVVVSLDRPSQDADDRGRLHLVVENCGRGPARDIDVALHPVDEADQVVQPAEPGPSQRVRLEALDRGERRAVPVAPLPGPVVAATCRWSDGFADYERHRLLKAV